jgi:hypothetical protein
MPAYQEYWYLAPLLAGLGFVAVLWFNWLGRAWRMERGINVHMALGPDCKGTTFQSELHVPPNAELSIQLRLRPSFHYSQSEFIFGFKSDDLDAKPEILSYLNTFIKRGQRQSQSPETHEHHSVDYNGSYHIKESRDLVKTTTYSYGFVIKTRRPGRYPVVVIAITDCGEAVPKEPMFLNVETRPAKAAVAPKRRGASSG